MNAQPSISELSDFHTRLRGDGVRLRTGPFSMCVRSSLNTVANALQLLYGDFPSVPDNAFVDFHVRVDSPSALRRIVRPQVQFYVDERTPFQPLPLDQAFPMLEWGLNWCVVNHAHEFLIIHSAVVAHRDRTVILPGDPGSGKSTLCSALVQEGWTLLSDEMCLIDLDSGLLHALARPINLKNDAIDLLADRYPHAVFGPRCVDTAKGAVAHLKPPSDSIRQVDITHRATHVVWPRYLSGSPVLTETLNGATATLSLVQNAFNYDVLGPLAFHKLCDTIDGCATLEFTYSDLDDGIAFFADLD
ncbi:MAG: HprK-related kinase A [Pseudomonadota bacterium]